MMILDSLILVPVPWCMVCDVWRVCQQRPHGTCHVLCAIMDASHPLCDLALPPPTQPPPATPHVAPHAHISCSVPYTSCPACVMHHAPCPTRRAPRPVPLASCTTPTLYLQYACTMTACHRATSPCLFTASPMRCV